MNVLFICNQNQNRSKTAEHLFKDKYQTKSAGLYNENPVDESQIAWADLVVVMEEHQREELSRRYPRLCLQKQIITLGIPDVYTYNQPELIQQLKEMMRLLV